MVHSEKQCLPTALLTYKASVITKNTNNLKVTLRVDFNVCFQVLKNHFLIFAFAFVLIHAYDYVFVYLYGIAYYAFTFCVVCLCIYNESAVLFVSFLVLLFSNCKEPMAFRFTSRKKEEGNRERGKNLGGEKKKEKQQKGSLHKIKTIFNF